MDLEADRTRTVFYTREDVEEIGNRSGVLIQRMSDLEEVIKEQLEKSNGLTDSAKIHSLDSRSLANILRCGSLYKYYADRVKKISGNNYGKAKEKVGRLVRLACLALELRPLD